MSKYFDEALKLSNLAVTLDTVSQNAVDRLRNDRLSGTTTSSRRIALDVQKSQRTRIALSLALRQEFTQCDDLGTFQESFRSLRTRLLRLRAERGLRSIVLTSPTKGEGKSAVSLNLAFSCAQLPEIEVLLIDADIRSCGLSQLLGAPLGRGLTEVLLQKIEPDEAILGTDLPNFHFLHSNVSSIPPAELLASRRWSELIASCVETFSLVIIDAPPILNLTDTDLISAPCDGVLVVARSHQTRTDFLERATSQIDAKKLVGVILNGAEESRDTYTYSYGSASRSVPVFSLARLFGPSNGKKELPDSSNGNSQ